MSNLVAIAYDDEYRADEVLTTLRRLERDYLIDLEDAAVATKNAEGKVKLHQSANLTASGAVGGGTWGFLVGLLFFAPVVGIAVGAGAGALAGKLSDYGINDNFAKQLAAEMKPRSSALFVLVRKATPDRVLPEIAQFGGTVLQTSLTAEQEARLQEAISTPASSGTT